MNELILLHGSEKIVERPDISYGNERNDYGRGFYCTEDPELAGEWACKRGRNGYINRYDLDPEGLSILDLTDSEHTVLNWIAILLKNRTFSLDLPVARGSREYMISRFAPDLSGKDLIIGYRADDSYFRYAEAFVENSLSLRSLGRALKLGRLGLQTVLVSPKAFDRIRFIEALPADKQIYYPRFADRDQRARRTYKDEVSVEAFRRDDIFAIDIIREEMKNDDPRIRQLLSE